MLDDGQPQTGSPGGAGAGGVDAVEALEDALLVLVGDADALVGDGDLDEVPAGRGHPPHRDADPGAGRGVVDGVLHEVAQGGGELAPVAPHGQAAAGTGRLPVRAVGAAVGHGHVRGHGDLLGGGLVPAAVDGLGDQLVHGNRFGVLQRVVVLHPGEVDQLLHQVRQPGRLHLHPAGEALHGLRVVRGPHDRLGQQGQRTDGRLQLVAHIGDEVPPDGLDPPGLGEVLHQQQHQPRSQRRHPGGDGQGLAPPGAPPGQVQLHLPYLPVPPGLPGHLQHGLDGEPSAADQSEGVGGGAGLDDGVGLVEDDRRGTQHRQDGVDPGREHGLGVRGGPCGTALLTLAETERQHRDHTGEHAGDRCRCGDRRVHVHTHRLGTGRDMPTAVRVRARTLVAGSSPGGQERFTGGRGHRRVDPRP